MHGDRPSFGCLSDEAAAGDEVRASGDSDEAVAAARGDVLPTPAGAAALRELVPRVGRGVPAPSPGAHQRVFTRVCGDSSRTAAFPDGCTLSRCATCSQSRLQLSSLPSAQLSNEDVDTAITLSVFLRFTRESECRMSE